MVKPTILLSTLLLTLAAPVAAAPFLQILGSGDLGTLGEGESFSYEHVFAPEAVGGDIVINQASLTIVFVDDHGCMGRSGADLLGCDWQDLLFEDESVAIEVAGTLLDADVAADATYTGDVTSQLLAGIPLEVGITAIGGDSSAWLSVLFVDFEVVAAGGGGGTPVDGAAPMPEPAAALCFAIGTLIVARATRR